MGGGKKQRSERVRHGGRKTEEQRWEIKKEKKKGKEEAWYISH